MKLYLSRHGQAVSRAPTDAQRPLTETGRAALLAHWQGMRDSGIAVSALIASPFVRAQQTWDRAFACRIAARLNEPDKPLVVGIIGRGHLEYRGGTPAQLEDLGVAGAAVLLPHDLGRMPQVRPMRSA